MSSNSFKYGPSLTTHGINAHKSIQHRAPNVLFSISRSRNGNVVVYEGITKNKKIIGVDAYWLNIDPVFKAKARKRGITHDREGLSVFDRIAYGYSLESNKNGSKVLKLRQCPEHKLLLMYHNGQARAYGRFQNNDIMISHIHVIEDGKLWPSVTSVMIYGKEPKTGKEMNYRLR
jgi:hypothetical protein